MKADSILIAHTDTVYCDKLKAMLSSHGHHVSKKVTNAFEALNYILSYRPKFAILGIDFSYLSAFDIEEAIIRKQIDTKVIFVLPQSYKGKLPSAPYFYKDDTIDKMKFICN